MAFALLHRPGCVPRFVEHCQVWISAGQKPRCPWWVCTGCGIVFDGRGHSFFPPDDAVTLISLPDGSG